MKRSIVLLVTFLLCNFAISAADSTQTEPQITFDAAGLLSGDLLVTFEPGVNWDNWKPHIISGICCNTIAVGFGISSDLEEKTEDELFKIPVHHGFTATLSFLLTLQDEFAGWFTPALGYEIIIMEKVLIGRYAVVEPQLQANLGTSYFMSLNLNIGIIF